MEQNKYRKIKEHIPGTAPGDRPEDKLCALSLSLVYSTSERQSSVFQSDQCELSTISTFQSDSKSYTGWRLLCQHCI